MSTTDRLILDLAALDPVSEAAVTASTDGHRRALASAWTGAAPPDARPSAAVRPRRADLDRRPWAGQVLVAASVALMVGGVATVAWVADDPAPAGVATVPDPDPAPVPGPVPAPDPGTATLPGPEESLEGVDLSLLSDAQAAAVADGVVTREEYDAGYQRYRTCLGAAGFEIPADPVVTRAGTHQYTVPDAAVDSGADRVCYEAEYGTVDGMWQTGPAVANHPSRTEDERECLERLGIEPADTLQELSQQLEDAGLGPLDCLPQH